MGTHFEKHLLRRLFQPRRISGPLIRPSDEQFDNNFGRDFVDISLEASDATPNSTDRDQHFMRRALVLAQRALEEDEVPVGALVVHNQRIIGSGWNQRENLQDPTAHAEMIAITQAAASLSSWRLEECTLVVTLEPCPMCAGAIVQSRIARVVYGAADPKAGAVDSLYRLLDDSRLNHRSQVTGGVLADECGALLSYFFKLKRQEGKK